MFYCIIFQEHSLCNIESLRAIEVSFMAQYAVCFCTWSVCDLQKMCILCLSGVELSYIYYFEYCLVKVINVFFFKKKDALLLSERGVLKLVFRVVFLAVISFLNRLTM